MDMRFSLSLPREEPSIPVVRRVVGNALRGLGVTADCVDDVLVALSEACTNAVQHARATGEYVVVGRVDEGVCTLKIMDWGRGPRPAPGERGILSESGRGIKIMRALVDDLDIDSSPDRGTIVHLRKRLTWRDEALVRRLDRRLSRSAG
ncbi:serine/threonine-protein kinase RsbW [Actinomadura pelletieri DSM 43383]|uniref:Serine/threonine-protein kinase RsbW n=2 Tax=Actinomadura pelletieri TaxID=111805 RepID=A0A495QZV8_9ACTN|nr:serine/threonine-protein kinase RsbW [Actinomadura pelletieri DSM 43383]